MSWELHMMLRQWIFWKKKINYLCRQMPKRFPVKTPTDMLGFSIFGTDENIALFTPQNEEWKTVKTALGTLTLVLIFWDWLLYTVTFASPRKSKTWFSSDRLYIIEQQRTDGKMAVMKKDKEPENCWHCGTNRKSRGSRKMWHAVYTHPDG